MNLSVSAKGIHSAQVASVMQACGCDYLQGPLLGHPLTPEDFEHGMIHDMRLDSSLLRGPTAERTLLLVDDEENILSSLRRLLRRDGYTILTATSGQLGLEALAISIDMAALMAGEVKITGVEAINPRIVLERSAQGAENWVFGGGGAGGEVSAATPGVGQDRRPLHAQADPHRARRRLSTGSAR